MEQARRPLTERDVTFVNRREAEFRAGVRDIMLVDAIEQQGQEFDAPSGLRPLLIEAELFHEG